MWISQLLRKKDPAVRGTKTLFLSVAIAIVVSLSPVAPAAAQKSYKTPRLSRDLPEIDRGLKRQFSRLNRLWDKRQITAEAALRIRGQIQLIIATKQRLAGDGIISLGDIRELRALLTESSRRIQQAVDKQIELRAGS